MRRTLLLIIFLMGISKLATAGIESIDGPISICPGEEAKFTVYYKFLFNIYGYPKEIVDEVTWEFIQNNVVVRTLKSRDFSAITPFGTTGKAEIIINDLNTANDTRINITDLELGVVKVRVLVKTVMFLPYSAVSPTYKKEKDFLVGLAPPTTITGSTNICPGTSGNLTASVVANATSYTWAVPSDWKVNGINGPVVAGQGNSVSITVPPCSGSASRAGENAACSSPYTGLVKVKGVSSTCGESGYKTKTVAVDYPFAISHYESSNTVTFSVSPSGFQNYQWTFPDYWTPANTSGYSVQVTHHSQPGYADLTVKTYCNNYYSTYYYFEPSGVGCLQPASAYPNPASTELIVEPPCLTELSSVAIEENGTFRTLELNRDGDVYKVDVSALNPGLHILKTKNSKGKEHLIRFLKSN